MQNPVAESLPIRSEQEAQQANIQKAQELLQRYNQSPLLTHLQLLSEKPDEQISFAQAISKIRWEDSQKLYQPPALTDIAHPKVITLKDQLPLKLRYISLGEQAYMNQEVAVLVLAGGQGQRMGCSDSEPKGCFPFGPVSGDSLYKIIAQKALAISQAHSPIHLVFITSDATDSATRSHFELNNNFGLDQKYVHFCRQGVLPARDLNGNFLLRSNTEVLQYADGHGGALSALAGSGTLDLLKTDGVKHVLYTHVDNPLAPLYDPMAVAALIANNAEMLTKVWPCNDLSLSVGRLTSVNGTEQILEYVDLNRDWLSQLNAKQQEDLKWANATRHVINIDFLHRVHNEETSLPQHLSRKELSVYHDGQIQNQTGYKAETFFFDLIPRAVNHLGLEIVADDEYAPMKDKTGKRSPEGARALLHNRGIDWLDTAGISHNFERARFVDGAVEAPNKWVEIGPMAGASVEVFCDMLKADRVAHIESDNGILYCIANSKL
jgi:UDP-N-acetylglucosamine pyrophosphorylase